MKEAYRHLSTPDGVVEVIVEGDNGPLLIIIPSLGRGAEDFKDLSRRISAKGFRVATWQPRGIGGSTGRLDDITLHDFARDVAAIIEALSPSGAVVVGHGYGNWIARTVATDRPDIVDSVIVLSAIGRRPVDAEVMASVHECANMERSDAERLEHLKQAFFAPGNDASVWLHGWFPEVMAAQSLASRRTPKDSYYTAGKAPLLLVQAAEDTVAPLQYAHLQPEEFGDRMKMVVIPRAGHAIVPEQPEKIANTISDHLEMLYGRPID
jgi:pimeloyl-ACP methyl ester carboxylesterase